ncbi:STAS domain-containing protein [Cytobacillus sp. FJAT-54145]|uniref:Anti-sigma factor antagonist n=1 Tax=Cytobacillus spartinae TaxID=3299023 RepID=A0ABW6KAM7_9BACI
MKKEISVQDNQVIVRLSDSIYVEEASTLRDSVLSYIDKGYSNFLLDLTNLRYIDSSGLGVLIAIQKRTAQQNGTLVIKGLNGAVKELFELTRLTQVFDIQ